MEEKENKAPVKSVLLFTSPTCHKCPMAKAFVDRYKIKTAIIEVNDDDTRAMALDMKIRSVPQFVVNREDDSFEMVTQEEIVELLDLHLLPLVE